MFVFVTFFVTTLVAGLAALVVETLFAEVRIPTDVTGFTSPGLAGAFHRTLRLFNLLAYVLLV